MSAIVTAWLRVFDGIRTVIMTPSARCCLDCTMSEVGYSISVFAAAFLNRNDGNSWNSSHRIVKTPSKATLGNIGPSTKHRPPRPGVAYRARKVAGARAKIYAGNRYAPNSSSKLHTTICKVTVSATRHNFEDGALTRSLATVPILN